MRSLPCFLELRGMKQHYLGQFGATVNSLYEYRLAVYSKEILSTAAKAFL